MSLEATAPGAWLVIKDSAIPTSSITSIQVVDGNTTDSSLELRVGVGGATKTFMFHSQYELNAILEDVKLKYTPSGQEQGQ